LCTGDIIAVLHVLGGYTQKGGEMDSILISDVLSQLSEKDQQRLATRLNDTGLTLQEYILGLIKNDLIRAQTSTGLQQPVIPGVGSLLRKRYPTEPEY
jgi:hypothetical protein